MLDFSSLPPSRRMSPAGGHELEAADVVADRAVLDGPAAAGVGGDEAAHHGALVAGVGRKIEPALLDGLGEIGQPHAGLGHGHLVVGVDLEDPVHPLEGEDDPAADRDAAAAEARGPAARRHRDAVGVGDAQDGRDLFRRPRPDDEVRVVGDLLEREFVVAVVGDPLGVGKDVRGADGAFDGGPHGRGDYRRHGRTSCRSIPLGARRRVITRRRAP